MIIPRAAVALLIVGCVPAAVGVGPAPPGIAEAAVERWVDASAPEGGDGTPAHPFKRLNEALAPDAIIRLRSGLYPGPWVLPGGVRLAGQGEVVLYAEGETTVVTAESTASLEGLSIQGGFVGMRALGSVTLRRIHFSGHRRVALEASSALTL